MKVFSQSTIFFICFFLAILFIISGCGKRYWYRIKIRGQYKSTHAIKIEVRNYSPEFLSKAFEDKLIEVSRRQLKKVGYIVSPKDSPVFRFVLSMRVDSFNAVLRENQRPSFVVQNPYDFSLKQSQMNYYRNAVKNLLFECQFLPYKNPIPNWTVQNDLYFFNDYQRDLGRSAGMVRYIIKYGNRNKEFK